ncbi:hypothetical protein IJE86_01765 [bacterium]|nr:hypothetical protein [bacterium]
MDKILKVAKRLKTFTLDDIVMFCEIETTTAVRFLQRSENIKPVGNKFEYVELVKTEEKFKIVDKNIECKNFDITVVQACEMFLKTKQQMLTEQSYQAYKTFVYSKIIPYFKDFLLKDITTQDVHNFKKYLQENKVAEPRIKNILALLNQIIKHFQNEGYIERTCIFEVKRIANIPKREKQVLTPEQLALLFKITKRKYPYLVPIVQKMNTLKQPLNTILTGNEQQKKSLKRKIRKDFYKIKQEMGLENYKLDDLRYCNK